MAKGPHEPYLASAGERYHEAYGRMARAVRGVFPKAKEVFESDMPAWKVPRPPGAPRPAREGTMPADTVFIGLVERKAGLTVHLWYPGDYSLFDHHKDALGEAGFKAMRGCLVYNRKGPFPVEAVETLLRRIREADERGA